MAQIETYPDGTPAGTDKIPYVEDPAGTPALKLVEVSSLGGGGGSSLLASASLNNVTQQNVGGSSGPTIVDAALTVTVTAPPSGSVIVMLQAAAYGNPGDSGVHWLLMAAGSAVAGTTKFVTALGVANLMAYSVLIPLDGLTPGDSYTWEWGGTGSYAGGGYATTYGGAFGAAVMVVLAV